MIRLLIVSLFALLHALPASASDQFTTIYFVRHAETMGNVTHHHSRENDRTFSPKGQEQVARLTEKLDQIHFDAIITSPKFRAMNTIFPYLQKHHQQAEIWPELAECCWQKSRDSQNTTLTRGRPIHISATMQPYFIFPDADDHYHYRAKTYADGISMVQRAAARIRSRFAGSGKRILVITHYHSGGRIMDILTGREPTGSYKLANAAINILREDETGAFRISSGNE